MRTYSFQVFPKNERSVDLRFLGPDGGLVGRRELDVAAVERFAAEVDAEYRKAAPRLADFGARLYEWLDGPTERWLEEALQETAGLVLHIDVSERLRHLPWELLCRSGAFVGANPHRPFTPVRYVKGPHQQLSCDNRPLRILFMACSPEAVAPVLNFEAEESGILQATRGRPLELIVEESGSLRGLEERLVAGGPGSFDVVHLSGHATVKDGTPCFLMEDELGHRHEASADEIARTFGGHFPKLLFV